MKQQQYLNQINQPVSSSIRNYNSEAVDDQQYIMQQQ